MKILTPAEFMSRLKKGEESRDILLDDDGAVKAKLVGLQASLEISSEDRSVNFTISTGAVDRYNSTIAPEGWQLENYVRNPVVLWAHDDYTPAIGRAEETKIDGKSMRSRVVFATRELHPLADTIYGLVKAGFINGASVGWIPLEWKFVDNNERGFGVDYTQQELLEWSVCNIPANPECLKDARSIGIDINPLRQWVERTLDQGGSLLFPRIELEALRKAAGAPTMSKPAPAPAATESDPVDHEEKAFSEAAAAARTLLKVGSIDQDAFADLLVSSARKIFVRAGRVLSKENEDTLRAAHQHCMDAHDHCVAAYELCKKACEHVMSVVEQNSDADHGDDDPDHEQPTGDDNDPDDPDNKDRSAEEMRQRRVRLLKLSASPLAIAAGITQH